METSSHAQAADTQHWSPRLWAILIVLCGALFLDGLDVSMVGVALPDIRTALGLSTSSLQWVVSGYVLGYGGLLLLGGRAADLLGRRRVFLAALAVFAVASLFGGLVSSPELLIGARFIKGIAAAFTAPAGLSLLTTTFREGPMRNRAISIYSAFGASGFSLGLVLSGLLTEVSWRLTLLVPAPVALLTLIAAIRFVPRGAHGSVTRSGRKFDIPGAVTVTGAMLLLVYTVVAAQQAGWGSARTIGSFAAVAVALAGFVAIERRSADPLVPLGIFRSGALTRANIGAMTLFGSYVSFQFLVTQYLQSLAGWSALSTALAFLPAGVVVAILSTRMSAIIGRFGPARVTVGAFISLVAGYVVFLRVGVSPDYPSVILPAVVLIGVAFGLGFSALSLAATAGIPDDEQGLAASLFQTSFQVGGAIVLAIVTAVVEAGGASQITTAQATLGAYRPALAVITAISAIGALTALSGLRLARRRAAVADTVPVQLGWPVPAPRHRRGVRGRLRRSKDQHQLSERTVGSPSGTARSVGSMRIRIGLSLGAAGAPDQFEASVALLEAAGVDSLWLPETVFGPAVDPFTGMTFALAKTTHLKVGSGISVLPGRHPVLVAKQLALLAGLAPGRVLPVFGLQPAVPGERALFPVPAGQRGAVFDEALALLRLMLTTDVVSFHGSFFTVEDASVGPLPAKPLDIWLAGSAPAALRRVGRLADGWLGSLLTPAEAGEAVAVINAAADEAGRQVDPDHFGISLAIAFGGLPDALAASIRRRRPMPTLDAGRGRLGGRAGPDRVVRRGRAEQVRRPPGDGAGSLEDFVAGFTRELAPLQT